MALANDVRLKKLFKQILKDIKPTQKEISDVNEYSNELMARLKEVAPKDVEIILAGSLARGTQVRGKSDIDIFLLFPRNLEERKMEAKAISLAKRIVRNEFGEYYEINYAEHPYLKLINKRRSLNADIVPAFKINDADEMATSVDRTQLHNVFVLKNLDAKQKDDVRIIKYLLQRHNIYGAESSRHAFSGYLCELLVCYYGSAENVLKAFSEAKIPIYINLYKKDADASAAAEASRHFNAPLIVIDPTDKNRNVAASVSIESLSRLILISRNLLANPAKKEFYGPMYSDEDPVKSIEEFRRAKGASIQAMCFKLPKISEDTLWPQLEKLRGRIVRELEQSGFGIALSFSRIEYGKGVIVFLPAYDRLNTIKRIGPDVTIIGAAEKFARAHGSALSVSVEGSRLIAIDKPANADVLGALQGIILDKKFKFTPDIKKSAVKIANNELSEDYALIVYHGLVEKLGI